MNTRYLSAVVRLSLLAVVVGVLVLVPRAGAQFLGPGEEKAEITLLADTEVYAWPDTQLNRLGEFPAGSVVPVNGRTPDSGWWRVNYPGGPDGKGWIPASAAQPNSAASAVTIVEVTFVTATPVPSPTVLPCQFNSSYVADVTIPDSTQVGGGQPFDKVWRMRNSGTCPWMAGTELVFQEGTQMSAPGSVIVPAASSGGVVDVQIRMTAPRTPGLYRGIWQMRNSLGQLFGDRITVVIVVPNPVATPTLVPPPTIAPPQPPQPSGINFWADKTRVNGGECTVLYWSTNNVQAVYLEYNGKSYGVDGNSSRQVCPVNDGKTYTLRVIMPDGSTQTREIRIDMSEDKKVEIRIWADREEVELGQCTRVNWETTNASKVEFNNGDDWIGVNRNDFRQVCPRDRTTYKVKVWDLYDDTHKRDVTVRVSNPS